MLRAEAGSVQRPWSRAHPSPVCQGEVGTVVTTATNPRSHNIVGSAPNHGWAGAKYRAPGLTHSGKQTV